MIGADHLVTIGDVGAGTQEQRAVVLHVLQKVIGVARHHLHVLGGDAVGLAQHLLDVLADDHLTHVRPGPTRGIGGGEDLEQPLDLRHAWHAPAFRSW